MTPTPPPSAPLSLTDQQKIEYLATKVMEWKKQWFGFGNTRWGGETESHDLSWNPLISWHHWREVEENCFRHSRLYREFLNQFIDLADYMESGLPTRVDALISAHQSLHV